MNTKDKLKRELYLYQLGLYTAIGVIIFLLTILFIAIAAIKGWDIFY